MTNMDVSIPENTPVGSTLLPRVNFTEQDAGDYPVFSLLRVLAFPDDGFEATSAFEVNPATGAIRLLRNVLDFESHHTFVLSLSVSDNVCRRRRSPPAFRYPLPLLVSTAEVCDSMSRFCLLSSVHT